jgi:uncharacterized membrane protein YbhN (UPF0104 family)
MRPPLLTDRRRRVLARLVGLGIMVGFLAYLWTIRGQVLATLELMSMLQGVGIVALLLVHWGIRAWRDRQLFAAAGHTFSTRHLYWLNSLRLALNYLPFKAGTVSASGLLVTRFGVRPRIVARVLIQQYLLGALMSSILAGVALWFTPASPQRGVIIATAGFAMVAGLALAGLSSRLIELGIPRRWRDWVGDPPEEQSLALWSRANRTLAILCGTTLLCLASALRMLIVLGIAGGSLNLGDALVVSMVVLLSPIIAITPAGFGVTEALVGLTAVAVGTHASVGVIGATIDRAFALGLSVLTTIVLWPGVRSSREGQ